MDSSEALYDKLRNIYSKEEPAQDSIGKGIATERIVNKLVSDITIPFKQELNVRIGKVEFDGRIQIGRGKTILYEIQFGIPARFKYDQILEMVKNTHFPFKTYIVIIAYRFPEEDKPRIKELVNRILTDKIKVCFMDYETLIALHRFTMKTTTEDSKKMKTMKRLFLEALFEKGPIVAESSFGSALSFAEKRYPFEMHRAETKHYLGPHVVVLEEPAYEQRIEKLEKIAEELLAQIRMLKEEGRKIVREDR